MDLINFERIISNRAASDRTGEPFTRCSTCEGHLGPSDLFIIAKAYHKGKCAIETVQCVTCQMESRGYASEQSTENIMLYSGRRFNQFMNDPIQRKMYHIEDPSCLISGEELALSDTFEMYCFNVPGSNLDDTNFLFVGPTAIEQMSELLSEETRRSWGRRVEEMSPDAPEIIISPVFM
ncbi:hypothetical protein SCOR_15555 [Sulfidibacter corallicola]|uniref:Uncharacterized protein n=1 Tax=Sulfidibacter corallicola TaxID=2818388 RepID=A0A8A4TXQ8_SULCO|nr:hypothetical protein [Sulfidibacter corallicola]QTD54117.1 hypothetical protein J3U87_16855 [Sulfidibacter corallicola]